ncbi:hypothetical protein [Cellulomonas sp. Y8]|uniref:hypothetical protein n=1 Tax=Cellulomonas sp. Y8 TaxID=2591145 RepID=UPI0011C78067|nr:hypothetical protein [Cellulomonas sp. Y8]
MTHPSDGGPGNRPSRRALGWLLVAGALMVAAAAIGVLDLVGTLPAGAVWAWAALVVAGAASAGAAAVVAARDSGASVARTIGRALLAPVRFLLELP